MTPALSTLTPGRGIAPVSRALADLTSRLHNKLEPIPGDFRRCALSSAAEPTAEQRAALMARRDDLDAALMPADAARVLRSVGMLRSVMAVAAVDEQTRQLQKQAFLVTLTKYPGWAVEAACLKFLDADGSEGIHAPKPGEIAVVCRKLIAEVQYERAKINAILDAEVYVPPTDEERARVAKEMAAVVAELRASASTRGVTDAGSDAGERAKARAHLADLQAKAAKPEQEDAA